MTLRISCVSSVKTYPQRVHPMCYTLIRRAWLHLICSEHWFVPCVHFSNTTLEESESPWTQQLPMTIITITQHLLFENGTRKWNFKLIFLGKLTFCFFFLIATKSNWVHFDFCAVRILSDSSLKFDIFEICCSKVTVLHKYTHSSIRCLLV